MAEAVRVALAERGYDVVVSPTLAGLGAAVRQGAGARSIVVVTDDNVAPLWLSAVQPELEQAGHAVRALVIPAGEIHKHRDTWWSIVDGLIRGGCDRKTLVVALGGGVVGDLAGFAAATTLRGLDVVQVPTTLLAMLDSSVGGKTGLDHELGKNLVGAFHQPTLVWAPIATLATLPAREVRAGLGELVKHALIEGEERLAELERDAADLQACDPAVIARVVRWCVASKARVVVADEREGGLRAILNLGHTVAHAVEVVLGFGELLHGEAVCIGLIAEQRFAERAGFAQAGLADRLVAWARSVGLPHALPDLALDALAQAAGLDKKAHGAMLSLPVCVRPGEVRLISWPRARLGELFERP